MPPHGFLPFQHSIDGYGRGGFSFANMSHQGAVLSVPSGMFAWGVSVHFMEQHFERVFNDAALIDIFFLGCGDNIIPVQSNVRQLFKEHKIAFDIMPTASAARTYNVLLSEGRRVACGLIAVA